MSVIEDTLNIIDLVTAQSREMLVGLSAEALNWKPAPERWSIAQCLDHLISAHSSYFPIFDQVRRGEYRRRLWERVPLLPVLFGRSLVEGMRGEAAEMIKAPAVFWPSQSGIPADIVPRFLAHQDELAEHIRRLREEDLGRVITSPEWSGSEHGGRRYSAFTINVEHLKPWHTLTGRQAIREVA